MQEKYLISQLQALKQIKPNQEWVFSVKNNILGNTTLENNFIKKDNRLNTGKFLSTVSTIFSTRRLSYALAAFLFVFIGTVGLSFVPQDSQSIPTPVAIKNDVEAFKITSQDLAAAVMNGSSDIPSAKKAVKAATKTLTDSIQKDPSLAKKVAIEVKDDKALLGLTTSADPEVKEASDILYKTINIQMIEDLEKATLTVDQQQQFEAAKTLFNEGKYVEALEKILLITN